MQKCKKCLHVCSTENVKVHRIMAQDAIAENEIATFNKQIAKKALGKRVKSIKCAFFGVVVAFAHDLGITLV